MKQFRLIPIFIISLILTLASCAKDEKNVAPGILPSQINNAIIEGTWDITKYEKSGTDLTAEFSEYTFAFQANDTVVATAAASKKGIWRSIAEEGITKINFDLKEEGVVTDLDSISKIWNVFAITPNTVPVKIEMKRIEEDGSVDLLTFEKN